MSDNFYLLPRILTTKKMVSTTSRLDSIQDYTEFIKSSSDKSEIKNNIINSVISISTNDRNELFQFIGFSFLFVLLLVMLCIFSCNNCSRQKIILRDSIRV